MESVEFKYEEFKRRFSLFDETQNMCGALNYLLTERCNDEIIEYFLRESSESLELLYKNSYVMLAHIEYLEKQINKWCGDE